ncbi:MAG: hypothetical protein HQL21_00030 [Candidatus Omnitrophica bacterium]|nr:hypothetical protein [Candidatus Omnitrophota bacterium]
MIDIPDSFLPQDSNGLVLCPKCKRVATSCDCPVFDPIVPKGNPLKPIIRLEKSGRKGKVVTVIQRLPRDES